MHKNEFKHINDAAMFFLNCFKRNFECQQNAFGTSLVCFTTLPQQNKT